MEGASARVGRVGMGVRGWGGEGEGGRGGECWGGGEGERVMDVNMLCGG